MHDDHQGDPRGVYGNMAQNSYADYAPEGPQSTSYQQEANSQPSQGSSYPAQQSYNPPATQSLSQTNTTMEAAQPQFSRPPQQQNIVSSHTPQQQAPHPQMLRMQSPPTQTPSIYSQQQQQATQRNQNMSQPVQGTQLSQATTMQPSYQHVQSQPVQQSQMPLSQVPATSLEESKTKDGWDSDW